MSAETKSVFLDTEPFKALALDFSSNNLKRLIRLAKEGELQLILTDVTEQEIRNHIDDYAKKAFKQIRDCQKTARIVKNLLTPECFKALSSIDEERLRGEMQSEFSRFLQAAAAQILLIDHVSPKAVFEKYFRSQPPFSESGNKKCEFPDAFAAAALQAWCETVPGRKLYVVSRDRDWERTCKETTSFIHVGELNELLEKYADVEVVADLKKAIRRKSGDVISFVKEKIEDGHVYFYVDDSVLEGEVDSVEVVDAEIADVHVVEATEGVAALNVAYNVTVTLFITADDPNSSYRDPDDGERRSVWKVNGSVEREIEMDATVDIAYDMKDPTAIRIKCISIPEEGVCISVDEDELSPNYDDDDDDPEIYGPEDPEDPGEEPT